MQPDTAARLLMQVCEVIVGVIIAKMMDPVTGSLPASATTGLIVVVSDKPIT